MPSSAWARERAEELLPCDCAQEDGEHKCPFHWAGAAVGAALDEAEARGASRLRKRIEAMQKAKREEQARCQAKGFIAGAYVAQQQAGVLRELLEEEG